MREWSAMLLLLVVPAAALAKRPVTLVVQLNGKNVLKAMTFDDGFGGPPIVWRYLKTTPLRPVDSFAVPRNPADPSEGLLKGEIVVEVQCRAGTSAGATDLRLKEVPQRGWIVSPDWVEANAPPGNLAEEETRVAASRAEHRREREAYRRGSFAAVGFAVASCVGSLVALAALRGGCRRWLGWGSVAAVGFGALALAWRFVGSPDLPTDDRYHDIRVNMMYVGGVSCGFAGCVWWLGRRPRGLAKRKEDGARSII